VGPTLACLFDPITKWWGQSPLPAPGPGQQSGASARPVWEMIAMEPHPDSAADFVRAARALLTIAPRLPSTSSTRRSRHPPNGTHRKRGRISARSVTPLGAKTPPPDGGLAQRLVRHILHATRRRRLRDLQQRAAWAEEAQAAPTLRAWLTTAERVARRGANHCAGHPGHRRVGDPMHSQASSSVGSFQ
jgi:hypothetical protein